MKKILFSLAVCAFTFAATGAYACSLQPKVTQEKAFASSSSLDYV